MYISRKSYSSAQKQTFNGKIFDSKFEAGQAQELELRKRAKDIKDYETQVEFPLIVNGYKLGVYIADFVIEHNDGEKEILEAKGFVGREFPMKWKLVEALYGDEYKLTIVWQGKGKRLRRPKKVIEF